MSDGHRNLFSDDPIEGTDAAPDRLSRTEFASHLVKLLQLVRKQSDSSVAALIGPWGAGKSSVLNLATRILATADNGWTPVDFNPWNYSDSESMIAGFFSEIRNALPSGDKWNTTREKIGNFGRSISPLGKIAAVVGFDASTVVDKVSEWVAGDNSSSKTRERASDALREYAKPILVILDDLDRLTPSELLLVFKLVRNVGRLPNLYYILSYDEQSLLDLLKRTEVVRGNEERARRYLEKMVQVRIDLPPLRERQSEELINLAFDQVLNNNNIELSKAQFSRINAAYGLLLQSDLSTPRAITRFFAQLDAFSELVHGEVDYVDFLLLSYVRTAYPSLYRLLSENKDELAAVPRSSQVEKHEDRYDRWATRLRQCGVSKDQIEPFMRFLGMLFLPIRAACERVEYSSAWLTDIGRQRGVGHPDYFDRYFAFGVPAEDISDRQVVSALSQISLGIEKSTAIESMRVKLLADCHPVLRKIQNQIARGGVDPVPVLRFLQDLYFDVQESARMHLFSSPRRAMEHVAFDLLREVGVGSMEGTVLELSASDPGICLISNAYVHYVRRGSEPGKEGSEERGNYERWKLAYAQGVLTAIKDKLSSLKNTPIGDISTEIRELFWVWNFIEPETVKLWLQLQFDEDRWKLLDFICSYVPVHEDPNEECEYLGDISAGLIDQLIGLDYVFSKLDVALEEVDPFIKDPWTRVPVESLEHYVLGSLRAMRDEREASS
ncbi:KAP family P-loop NTPase fold protein [Amycolatopsis methanolica]|uniref:KAP P-loop domain-containing protein n=1 Tax=Amycolatopsis methanolica 239 TaxID=1068978 RepID=A0A076N115_AMYME|nr:P-loop NTPase fold protein [Amycolatopsis methanolica]AIJ24791.1 KAP P-loop domain-containing protein [Amycolatopsis methanolica 239]